MLFRCQHRLWGIVFISAAALIFGCAGPQTGGRPTAGNAASIRPDFPGLEPLHPVPELRALVDPPIGWRLDKQDVDAKHSHFTWLSPSGDTAYGAVLMNLPLPVGPDMVLWGFLNHLRAADKKAELLEKQSAPDLQGIRFVAESGLYRIRVNLIVHDWHAWAIYAGTVHDKPERADELLLAEQARDRTRTGISGSGK
jgi:hypothetical protein